MVHKALKQLGVDANATVYIGDSDVDIQTAKNAGVPSICVLWGFRDKEFLLEHGAEQFIEKPEDIIET